METKETRQRGAWVCVKVSSMEIHRSSPLSEVFTNTPKLTTHTHTHTYICKYKPYYVRKASWTIIFTVSQIGWHLQNFLWNTCQMMPTANVSPYNGSILNFLWTIIMYNDCILKTTRSISSHLEAENWLYHCSSSQFSRTFSENQCGLMFGGTFFSVSILCTYGAHHTPYIGMFICMFNLVII